MASVLGRGAQVRLDEAQRAAARGASGSLLDNLLAKRREEDRGLGARGDTSDGSTWTGTEALDEVLTPGGRLDGYVPGQSGQPATAGILRGGLGAAFGFNATGTGLQRASGALQGFTAPRTAFAGTARGPAQIGGQATAVAAFAGSLLAPGRLGGEVAVRSGTTGALLVAGPIQGSLRIRSRVGSGLFGDADAATRLSGSLVGLGALATGTGTAGGSAANSAGPANGAGAANASDGAAPIPAVALVSAFAAARGALAGMSGAVISGAALAGTLAGVGGDVLTPTTVTDRAGTAITLRDGTSLESRPLSSEAVQGRDGATVTLRDGTPLESRIVPTDATTGRDGVAILLRDGTKLTARVVADAVEPPPVVVAPPVDTTPSQPVDTSPATFPTGPYLLAQPVNSGCVIERQDGRSVRMRLIRPIYSFTGYCEFNERNTTNYARNIFYSTDNGGRFAAQNSQLCIPAGLRELSSLDDGTYTFTVYRAMSDDTFLSVDVTLIVAADATTQNPQPTPKPIDPIFLENFDPGRGVGALVKTWQYQRFVNTPQGTILLDGSDRNLQPDGSYDEPGCSMMTLTTGDYSNKPVGFGNGLFEFRAKFTGDSPGYFGQQGPAIILWPVSDVWPGPEIDLGEINQDGHLYLAFHYKDPVTGQDVGKPWAVSDQPARFPNFDHRVWHTYSALCENSRVTFYVDGKVLFTRTENVVADYANGGENHAIGLQNDASTTKLECDWIRHVPLGRLSGLITGGQDYALNTAFRLGGFE